MTIDYKVFMCALEAYNKYLKNLDETTGQDWIRWGSYLFINFFCQM